jgi:hypothetical protein
MRFDRFVADQSDKIRDVWFEFWGDVWCYDCMFDYLHRRSGESLFRECPSCEWCYTRETWLLLHPPRKGEVQDDGEGGRIILRQCLCGDTLAVYEEELAC